MSDVAVGARYAQAFLGLSTSPEEGEELARLLESAARAYSDSGELRSALSNPVLPLAQRESVVAQVVTALGGTDLARRCLLVMLRRGRISALPEAAMALREMVDESRGVLRGQVITARPMPDTFYADLERNLSARHGKNVVLDRRVDADLVGGIVTHVDGQTIDQSVRGTLGRIERELLESIGKAGAIAASSA